MTNLCPRQNGQVELVARDSCQPGVDVCSISHQSSNDVRIENDHESEGDGTLHCTPAVRQLEFEPCVPEMVTNAGHEVHWFVSCLNRGGKDGVLRLTGRRMALAGQRALVATP